MLPFRPEGYEFRAFELLRLLRWKHANELKIASGAEGHEAHVGNICVSSVFLQLRK